MKPITIPKLQALIERAIVLPTVGDSFLDARYANYARLVGHDNPYYRLMYLIAQTFLPDLTVELGSYRGDAAANAARGNPDGKVITIDIHKDDLEAQRLCREAAARYPNLIYIHGWTWDVISQVVTYGKIDVLFIDSWHDYDHASVDWKLYSPQLSDGALVICDDILPDDPSLGSGGMFRFWNEISLHHEAILDARLHPGIPMGFLIYGSSIDAPTHEAQIDA